VTPIGSASTQFAGVYDVLTDGIRHRAFPGCAFGALNRGRVVLAGSLGRFTYDASSPAVLPETVFDIASLTKVVATTAIAMLLDQRGELNLEMPLYEVMPEFVSARHAADPARLVTLRHLLAHNSGLPGYREIFRLAKTPAEVYRACQELPIETIPGTRMEYSDPGFILLGKALEAITGHSLADWVCREILTPIGMTDSGYCPSPALRTQIPPTERDDLFRRRVIQGEVQDEHAYLLGGVAGHAGLFANVPDLLRFSMAIASARPAAKSTSLFYAETVNNFAQRQAPPGSSRALGWDTPSKDSSAGSHFSAHSIGHLGFSGCSLWIDLEADISAVLLTNRTWPDRSAQAIRAVRPAFHNALRAALHR